MPRRPKSYPRDRYVSFRCTEAEVTTLRRRADHAGMSLSDFARHALIERETGPVPHAVQSVEARSMAQVLAEQVRRVGVNINQIAHRMNELRIPPPIDLAPLLDEIRAYVRQARSL